MLGGVFRVLRRHTSGQLNTFVGYLHANAGTGQARVLLKSSLDVAGCWGCGMSCAKTNPVVSPRMNASLYKCFLMMFLLDSCFGEISTCMKTASAKAKMYTNSNWRGENRRDRPEGLFGELDPPKMVWAGYKVVAHHHTVVGETADSGRTRGFILDGRSFGCHR
jgi:hypothetical protein